MMDGIANDDLRMTSEGHFRFFTACVCLKKTAYVCNVRRPLLQWLDIICEQSFLLSSSVGTTHIWCWARPGS